MAGGLAFAKNDHDWSLRCRKRDRHRCRLAFPPKPKDDFLGCIGHADQVHHVYGRGLQETRLLLLNGLSICAVCHDWVEQHPTRGLAVCRRVIGETDWQILEAFVTRHYGRV